MRKLLVGLVSLGLLFSSAGLALAESPQRAVFFLRTETNQVPSGSTITYEVVANTMGQSVKDIDLNLIIRGPIPFNPYFDALLHPDHGSRLYSSTGLNFDNFAYSLLADGSYQVELKMNAKNSQGFNEGSAAIPIAKVMVPTNSDGYVRTYISEGTQVRYVKDPQLGFDNYTPETRSVRVTVGEGGVESKPISSEDESQAPSESHPGFPAATMRPTPSPIASLRPTPSPDVNLPPYTTSRSTSSSETVNDSVYDEEFARLEAEISRLQGQVDDQAERIGILERIIDSLQGWWQGLWRR